jgi:hypothetical protein
VRHALQEAQGAVEASPANPSHTPLCLLLLLLLQVRTASCAGTACVNSFGDEQLAVDMLADKLLFEALRFSVSSDESERAWGVGSRRRRGLWVQDCGVCVLGWACGGGHEGPTR